MAGAPLFGVRVTSGRVLAVTGIIVLVCVLRIFCMELLKSQSRNEFEFHLWAGALAECPEPLLACTSVLGETRAAHCGIDVPIFVVSLPGSPKRVALSESMKTVCPDVVLHFVDALDMATVAQRFSSITAKNRHDNELAVALSHLLAARAALNELRSLPQSSDSCPRMALVVEDDVDFAAMPLWKPSSIRAWCTQAKLPNEWEVVQMGLNTNRNDHPHLPEVLMNTPSLFSPRTRDHYGAYALLYSEHGLSNLLQHVTCSNGSNGEDFCIGDLPQISDVLIFTILQSAWISNPPYFLHPVFSSGSHHQNWRLLADLRENAMDVMMSRWCPELRKLRKKQPCMAGHLVL